MLMMFEGMRVLHPVVMLVCVLYSCSLAVSSLVDLWSKHSITLYNWRGLIAFHLALHMVLFVLYFVYLWRPPAFNTPKSPEPADEVKKAQQRTDIKLQQAVALDADEVEAIRSHRIMLALYTFYYGATVTVSVFCLAHIIFVYSDADQGKYMDIANEQLNSRPTLDYPRSMKVVLLQLVLATSFVSMLSAMPAMLRAVAMRKISIGLQS